MTDTLGATGWAYDRAGRMVSQTDPNGATLGWAYDPAGRLTTLSVPYARIGYDYDAAGRVTSQSSPWGSLAYSFDPVGNLLTESRSSGITTTNTYDALGQVTSITHQTPRLPDLRSHVDGGEVGWRWPSRRPDRVLAGTRTITDDTRPNRSPLLGSAHDAGHQHCRVRRLLPTPSGRAAYRGGVRRR